MDLLVDAPADAAGRTVDATGLDPLGLQWRAFVRAALTREPPENDGRVGVEALRLVERVRAAIRRPRPEDARSSGQRDMTEAALGDDPLLRR